MSIITIIIQSFSLLLLSILRSRDAASRNMSTDILGYEQNNGLQNAEMNRDRTALFTSTENMFKRNPRAETHHIYNDMLLLPPSDRWFEIPKTPYRILL